MGTLAKTKMVQDYETLATFKETFLEMLSLVHGTAALEAYNNYYKGEIFKFADGLRVEIRESPLAIRVNPVSQMTTRIVSA